MLCGGEWGGVGRGGVGWEGGWGGGSSVLAAGGGGIEVGATHFGLRVDLTAGRGGRMGG